MSVKIIIEVIADTLDQAFLQLSSLDKKAITDGAAKGSTASESSKPASKKDNAEPVAQGVKATPPARGLATAASAATATAETEPAAKPVPTVTAGELIMKANKAVANDTWGASIEDRKAQIMGIPKKYGANRYAEITDAAKLVAAAADIDALTTSFN